MSRRKEDNYPNTVTGSQVCQSQVPPSILTRVVASMDRKQFCLIFLVPPLPSLWVHVYL